MSYPGDDQFSALAIDDLFMGKPIIMLHGEELDAAIAYAEKWEQQKQARKQRRLQLKQPERSTE